MGALFSTVSAWARYGWRELFCAGLSLSRDWAEEAAGLTEQGPRDWERWQLEKPGVGG